MKIQRLHDFFKHVSISAIAILICSCSEDTVRLLDTIPGDADYVFTVNMRELLQKPGCDNIDMVADAAGIIPGFPDELKEKAADIGKCIDTDMIAGYGYGNSTILTFGITDKSMFKSILKDTGPSTSDGFTVYPLSDAVILTKGNQGWICRKGKPVEKMAKALETAKTSPFTGHEAIAGKLDTGNIAVMVMSPKFADSSLGDYWPVLSADIIDNAIVLKLSAINTQGENYSLTQTRELSTDFLRYVPQDFAMAAAVGLTDKVNWDAVAAMAGMMGGHRSCGLADTLLPYLKSIDGTVAVAAWPAEESAWTSPSMENTRVLFMAHMPVEKTNMAIGQIDMLMRQMRIPSAKIPGGLTANMYGVELNAVSVDGYLALSTIPVAPTHSNQLTPYFTGKHGAAVINIPSLQPYFGSDADFGASIKLALEPQQAVLQMEFPGTGKPVIAALLSLMK